MFYELMFHLLFLLACDPFFQVAYGYAPNLRKTILLHFLHLFQSKQLGQDQLVVAMQMLVLPMLGDAFQKNMKSEVVDPAILKTIVEKLLDPPEEVLCGTLQTCLFFCIVFKSLHFGDYGLIKLKVIRSVAD